MTKIATALCIGLFAATTQAQAAKCGNNSSGFKQWVADTKKEAARKGFSQRTINATLGNVSYQTKTIRLDRNQSSFRLSLNQFMKKRGANGIVSRGKRLKKQHARLFNRIEQTLRRATGRDSCHMGHGNGIRQLYRQFGYHLRPWQHWPMTAADQPSSPGNFIAALSIIQSGSLTAQSKCAAQRMANSAHTPVPALLPMSSSPWMEMAMAAVTCCARRLMR